MNNDIQNQRTAAGPEHLFCSHVLLDNSYGMDLLSGKPIKLAGTQVEIVSHPFMAICRPQSREVLPQQEEMIFVSYEGRVYMVINCFYLKTSKK